MTQELILLRGHSGSGKSTRAKKILGHNSNFRHVETDHFFSKDGVYKFNKKKLIEAHFWCLKQVESYLKGGFSVVVSNTFTKRNSIFNYLLLSEKYDVYCKEEKCTGEFQNIHGVSPEKVKEQKEKYEPGFGEKIQVQGVIGSKPFENKFRVVFRIDVVSENIQFGIEQYYAECTRDNFAYLPKIKIGEFWCIQGYTAADTTYIELINVTNIQKKLPTGINLQLFFENSLESPNIGRKKITHLFSTYKDKLNDVLEEGDVISICQKTRLTTKMVQIIVDEYQNYKEEIKIVNWLDEIEAPPRLASDILQFWGKAAIKVLKKDPYKLLPFLNWEKVDTIAAKIGIPQNDPRRILGAMECICYDQYQEGNTAVNPQIFDKKMIAKVGQTSKTEIFNNRHKGLLHRTIVRKGKLIQSAGAFILEEFVEHEILARITESKEQLSLFKTCLRPKNLFDFEAKKRIAFKDDTFSLNNGQHEAISLVLDNPVSFIFGGTGVGKTTVLDAICSQIESHVPIYQIALTRKATNKMMPSTGRETSTIAKFLWGTKKANGKISENSILFIDESSMLDIPTVYMILRAIPYSTKICFLGDSNQLPPIGPGLFFHTCKGNKYLPQVELTEVHRQAAKTRIPSVAKDILELSKLPKVDSFVSVKQEHLSGVSFKSIAIDTRRKEAYKQSIIEHIMPIWRKFSQAGEVQIIAAKNKTCNMINSVIHGEKTDDERYRTGKILESIDCGDGTKISENDVIIWHTVNDYDRRLFNGTLGKVTQIFHPPLLRVNANKDQVSYVAQAEFDKELINLTGDDLKNISLGYAIPCHISQGSQWERVIVVVEDTGKKRLVDNAWLYTAVTRAEKKVFLIGNEKIFTRECKSEPRAFNRVHGLSFNVEKKEYNELKDVTN